MPHLDRGLAPVVVEPVAIGHGGGHQLVDIDAIQSGDVDIVAGLVGHVRRVDALERAHAASARVAAAIVRQRRFTGNEAEGLGLHHHRPEAHLHADAVHLRLDAHGAAMAAPARANRHSLEPTHCGDEIEEALEVNGSTVVARGEATKVLHPIEASLDAVAMFVDEFVVGDDDLARAV